MAAAAKPIKCVECASPATFGLHEDGKIRWCFGCAKAINARNSKLEGDFKPAAVMLVDRPTTGAVAKKRPAADGSRPRGRPKGSKTTKKKVVVKASHKSAAGKAKGPIGKAGKAAKTKQVYRPNKPKPPQVRASNRLVVQLQPQPFVPQHC